jgi:hypothetical protein
MNIRSLAVPALAAALLGAAVVHAQTPSAPVTDVGPPPAEERASAGAIVLEKSPVQAQKKALAESDARARMTSSGSNVMGAGRAPTKAELAIARDADAAELRLRGAGALTEK